PPCIPIPCLRPCARASPGGDASTTSTVPSTIGRRCIVLLPREKVHGRRMRWCHCPRHCILRSCNTQAWWRGARLTLHHAILDTAWAVLVDTGGQRFREKSRKEASKGAVRPCLPPHPERDALALGGPVHRGRERAPGHQRSSSGAPCPGMRHGCRPYRGRGRLHHDAR